MRTEYTLSKHRYYELKHFCLQYPDWIKEYRDADGWSGTGDTTSRDGIKRAEIIRFVDLIQTCAYDTNRDLLPFVTGASRDSKTIIRTTIRRKRMKLSKNFT